MPKSMPLVGRMEIHPLRATQVFAAQLAAHANPTPPPHLPEFLDGILALLLAPSEGCTGSAFDSAYRPVPTAPGVPVRGWAKGG
jgi:hypothetical protein